MSLFSLFARRNDQRPFAHENQALPSSPLALFGPEPDARLDSGKQLTQFSPVFRIRR
jgi:hypothetical protein